MITNNQTLNSGFNQNQLQNTLNAELGQLTTNETENALNAVQGLLYSSTLVVQVLNVLLSQLGFKDKDKVTLQALFGLSQGKVEFSSYYQDIAKQIWEKEKFSSYYINSAIHKSTHTRMIRNRLNSIDSKQKEWKLLMLDWTPGDKVKGEEVASDFKFYLVEYVYQALELAQKEDCFERDIEQAIRKAVSKVVEQLTQNGKVGKGSSKKVKSTPREKTQRYFKASLGTMNRAIKTLEEVDDPPEAISQQLDEMLEGFNVNFRVQKSELMERLKKREEEASVLSNNAGTEKMEKNDYPSMSERVVKIVTEKTFSEEDPKKENPTTLTNLLVKNFDIANIASKNPIAQEELEKVAEENLEVVEEKISVLEGGEGVQTCTDEHIDVEIRQESISTEKERDLEEKERTLTIFSLERKIEDVLEIDFSEAEEEQYFGQRKTSRYGAKPKALSKYSYEECFEYAKSLKGIHSPEIFATTIYESGERDKEVGKFVEIRKEAERKEQEEKERAEQELEESRRVLKYAEERKKVEQELWEKLSEVEKNKLIKKKQDEFLGKQWVLYRSMPEETFKKHAIDAVKKDLMDKWEQEQRKNSS